MGNSIVPLFAVTIAMHYFRCFPALAFAGIEGTTFSGISAKPKSFDTLACVAPADTFQAVLSDSRLPAPAACTVARYLACDVVRLLPSFVKLHAYSLAAALTIRKKKRNKTKQTNQKSNVRKNKDNGTRRKK